MSKDSLSDKILKAKKWHGFDLHDSEDIIKVKDVRSSIQKILERIESSNISQFDLDEVEKIIKSEMGEGLSK